MRAYATVSPTFHTGETGRAITRAGKDAKLVAGYLLTAPESNMIGLYYVPIVSIAHHNGQTFEEAETALRSLVSLGFCDYDFDVETVWVYNMAAWQVGETLKQTDNRVSGVEKELLVYRKSRFYEPFLARYQAPLNLTLTGSPVPAGGVGGKARPAESVEAVEAKTPKTSENTEKQAISNEAPLEGLGRGLEGAWKPLGRDLKQEQEHFQEQEFPPSGAGSRTHELDHPQDHEQQHKQGHKPTMRMSIPPTAVVVEPRKEHENEETLNEDRSCQGPGLSSPQPRSLPRTNTGLKTKTTRRGESSPQTTVRLIADVGRYVDDLNAQLRDDPYGDLIWWCRVWRERRGIAFALTNPKRDMQAFAHIRRGLKPPGRVRELMPLFHTTADSWIDNRGYLVCDFQTRIPKLTIEWERQNRTAKPIEAASAHTIFWRYSGPVEIRTAAGTVNAWDAVIAGLGRRAAALGGKDIESWTQWLRPTRFVDANQAGFYVETPGGEEFERRIRDTWGGAIEAALAELEERA